MIEPSNPSLIVGDLPVDPKIAADKAKADKLAMDKVIAEREAKERETGDKVLGNMEMVIGDKLHHMAADMDVEFSKLQAAYIDMPDEIKAHTMYKPMGEHIAAVEALLVTLKHTAATFPMPDVKGIALADPHDKNVPWHPEPLPPSAPMPGVAMGKPADPTILGKPSEPAMATMPVSPAPVAPSPLGPAPVTK